MSKRTNAQILADQIVSPELVGGAPSKVGGRVLSEDKDVWSHNAWDNIPWDEEMQSFADESIAKQKEAPVPEEVQVQLNAAPAGYWDAFYAQYRDKFFNDRAWLQNEFPEIGECLEEEAGEKRIVELGCGPGNTFFPIARSNKNKKLKMHGFDYSKEAINLMRSNKEFDPVLMDAQVWDLSSPEGIPETIPKESADIVTMIFVFSALHPNEWAQALKNVYTLLKPGGVMLFRDYGRNDMAQLRFKKGRYMQEGLYARGDNTRVYFFERDELIDIFGNTEKDNEPNHLQLIQLGVDRRLLLNRKRQIKMFRIWLQGRWKKTV